MTTTYKAPELEPQYREAFEGVLCFADFDGAEQTIRTLDNLCREYRLASDKKGVEYCRRFAYLGRRRAEAISRNERVSRQKRLQKKEIALWFEVWLETPAIFEDWLALRKNTKEFETLLKPEDC
jgi:hypothetical protein